MSIEFTAGTFVQLRATTSFHLGMIERDVSKGDIIEYDGTTLKLSDAQHNIPTLRAAIKAGWLVLSSDTTSTYRPAVSTVQVHAATSTGRDRGLKIEAQTVHEEDRDLGTLKQVRVRGDGTVRKMAVTNDEASSEGVAIGKINRPTHTNPKLSVENEMRLAQEVRQVDNVKGTPNPRVTPFRQPPNAHNEAAQPSSEDALASLLGGEGEVVVAKLPRITNTNPLGEGDSPHLTPSEKAERISAAREAVNATRAARIAASTTANSPSPREEQPPPATEAVEVLPADLGQKVQLVRAVIPTFEWDMTRPWKTRVADAMKRYGKNPLYLNGILSVEVDAVKNSIVQMMGKS